MKVLISDIEGFAPIASEQANLLVLGSIPGAASLNKKQYYGHPRNTFWPIMAELFGATTNTSYMHMSQLLISNKIAVWDVLKHCQRHGSLDTNIVSGSMVINDFVQFFDEYRRIKMVFFNGGTAEKLYKKHVFPVLPLRFSSLEYKRLPSTSPAYATVTYKEKLEAWRAIVQPVVK